MNGYHLNQKSIRTALRKKADAYDPPSGLKQKIDAQIAQQKNREVTNMKKIHVRKIVAAAALACAMTGTVCMAAGKISNYYGFSSEFTKITDFEDISRLEKKTGIRTGAKETLSNGFVFANANIINGNATDARDNVVNRFQEISVCYENGEKSIDYNVGNAPDTENQEHFSQKLTANGVTYYFAQDQYLFVPDGYEPTAEEQKAQESGELFICATSEDEREEQVYESLSWNVDGQRYYLGGADLDLGADRLLEMAEQMEYKR